MDLNVLSSYVDKLNRHGIEVWSCFDPDPNVIRIKVKKGDVCFEDNFEYVGFCSEFALVQMVRDLVNKVENATSEEKGDRYLMGIIRKSSIWDDRYCVCLFGRRFIFEKLGHRWRYIGWYRP